MTVVKKELKLHRMDIDGPGISVTVDTDDISILSQNAEALGKYAQGFTLIEHSYVEVAGKRFSGPSETKEKVIIGDVQTLEEALKDPEMNDWQRNNVRENFKMNAQRLDSLDSELLVKSKFGRLDLLSKDTTVVTPQGKVVYKGGKKVSM